MNKEESIGRLKNKVSKWGGNLVNVLTDYASGTAIVKISKDNNVYEFKHKAKNATESLRVLSWSVNRLIDCDIRGILPFEKTAQEYLQIGGETKPTQEADEKWFEILGLNSQASNQEIIKTFKDFAKDFHPDTIEDLGLKKDLENEFAKKSEAYTEIKKARGF